jgi:hypothetical protein
MTNPGIVAKIAASADTARPGDCPRCGAAVLRARAGRTAALDVIADPTPVDLVGEIQARLDGRLTWRLITTRLGVGRIVWRDPRRSPPPHPARAPRPPMPAPAHPGGPAVTRNYTIHLPVGLELLNANQRLHRRGAVPPHREHPGRRDARVLRGRHDARRTRLGR